MFIKVLSSNKEEFFTYSGNIINNFTMQAFQSILSISFVGTFLVVMFTNSIIIVSVIMLFTTLLYFSLQNIMFKSAANRHRREILGNFDKSSLIKRFSVLLFYFLMIITIRLGIFIVTSNQWMFFV